MKNNVEGYGLHKAAETFNSNGVMLNSPHTINHFTGIELPFATHFPDRPLVCFMLGSKASVFICPYEWSGAVADQGWQGDITAYGDGERNPIEFGVEVIAQLIEKSGSTAERIAIEEKFIPYPLYLQLQERFPKNEWVGVDKKIELIRMQKSPAALELLHTAAEQLEFGLIGAVQHLEGSLEENGYTLSEFCERIRVHVYETGGTAGGLAAVAAGKGKGQWYDQPQGKFTHGELVRIEATSRYYGYWANTSRMMVIGNAEELQKRAYAENLQLKNKAVSMLKPGVKCSTLYNEVADLASEEGIDFRGEFGIGHSIGVSEREAPFLRVDDDTALLPGMCIVVAVYTEGPQKELICVKDTYYISEEGTVCISDFHNWEVLYEVNGFRSAH